MLTESFYEFVKGIKIVVEGHFDFMFKSNIIGWSLSRLVGIYIHRELKDFYWSKIAETNRNNKGNI